ncbi:UDP-2,3-diacylglucosamine diphosphatase [Silanimonas sp.]|jgi:UDP-2,3-diacylglucosamine hydrolase|uniref:UDP-2,3-diacylglucosamine diphosphatase n=1 Tax=Silanimonas sp. TaxID=1929290 RepID=UPI0022BFE6AB|nr:UDP-2,3-diacylglucosamine diphosphatase [Silanimonas sp.]MCZ8114029.1 UDP-2,3-diacylglucosamine diphosphatase [Silanimonas sp.]
MTTLFLSDLHLDESRPDTTAQFEAFCAGEAREAEAVYLLGDLFEAFLGDDDDGEIANRVAVATRALRDAGVPVAFLRGNRDFLVGSDYAARAGWTLLPDPAVILLDGEPTLLMHGDLLCLDDVAYQGFRRQVRDPAWQQGFLAQPLAARRAFAAQARAASAAAQSGRDESIGDVTPSEVERVMAFYGVRRLIHGHTHRPAMHSVNLPGGRSGQRIVLGDWYDQGSVLRVDRDGFALSRPA